MFKFLIDRIYLKIYRNRFEVINLENGSVTNEKSEKDFSTERLLVGNFSIANDCLLAIGKNINGKRLLKRRFDTLIHPVEMADGGLCEVEEKIFRELTIEFGTVRNTLYCGPELTNEQALAYLRNA